MLAQSDLRPGYTLGRYEILMPVAQGGMAAVWAARLVGTRGFQKVVAIKTMLPELGDDPDFEAMFLDEARLAAKVRHPHVAEIIDLGEEEGFIYIVMEWVNGETIFTLNKQARKKGGIPLPLLLRILSDVCAGLHSAHELRDESGRPLDLVHRDISPQNIMISFDGIVKIVDFGVAKAAGRLHETRVAGIMKGKVPYLSPEQLTGQKVDRRSDIFSLGILMYVMVTGRHPFRGASDTATMENICTRAPVPLRELVPDVRPDVEALILKALEKNPADRFASCAEMQRAIDTIGSVLGTAVTDGDVAVFLKTSLGEIVEQRNGELATAIRRADERTSKAPSTGPRGRARAHTPAQLRRGAALSPTSQGILPVALDEHDASHRPASGPPSSLGASTASADRKSRARVPTFHPAGRKKRRPIGTISAFTVLALLGLSAFAVRAGMLPWVADHLPPWLGPIAGKDPAAASSPPPASSVADATSGRASAQTSANASSSAKATSAAKSPVPASSTASPTPGLPPPDGAKTVPPAPVSPPKPPPPPG